MLKKRSPGAESEEMAALACAVERSLTQGCAGLHHLSTPLGRANYLRKAEVVKNLKPDGGRLLDWGCGYGQMSYLLRNRGFEVVPYTIEAEEPSPSNSFLREQDLDVVYGEDPVRLPFEDESFDLVLSCGVLEHVEDENGSIAEIRRTLRPGGMFVVMMLPNEWSYAEFMARKHLQNKRPRPALFHKKDAPTPRPVRFPGGRDVVLEHPAQEFHPFPGGVQAIARSASAYMA